METVKCIKCEPDQNAEVVDLATDLESLQEAVAGYIEFVYPFNEKVCVMCNEEGKLEGLPFSRPILYDDGSVADLIAGTCYIMGDNDGEFRSLDDDEIKHFMKKWKYPIRVYIKRLPDRSIIEIEPFNAETGRKVKAYGR